MAFNNVNFDDKQGIVDHEEQDVDPEASPADYKKPALPTRRTNFNISMPKAKLPTMPMWSMPKKMDDLPCAGVQRPIIAVALIAGLLFAFITLVILAKSIADVKAEEAQYAHPYPDLCVSRDCLWDASEALQNMNISVHPCDDFLTYACGLFAQANPVNNAGEDGVTQFTLIDSDNTAKLQDILESPINDSRDQSYERKLKTFFTQCVNDYDNTENGGKPLVNQINQPNLGGWAAFYTFNNATWNFNQALQSAFATYGAAPFFTISVVPDSERAPSGYVAQQYVIEIDQAALGMNDPGFYLYTDSYSEYHKNGYITFIETIVQLLWQDGGFTNIPPEVLNETVSDIIYVETQIANIMMNAKYIPNNFKSISYIDQNYGQNIQWLNLLSTYFSGAPIGSNSPLIEFDEEDYIKSIAQLMTTLPRRAVNNYLIWKVVNQFTDDLGWSYIHATRVWALINYDGYVEFVGTYNWCFMLTEDYIAFAMDALYVQEHYAQGSNTQDDAITESIKAQLIANVANYQWMDAQTKASAIAKLKNTTDLIGYPAWLDSSDQVDFYYQSLNIQPTNTHFENMVAIYTFQSYQYTKEIIQLKINKSEWPDTIYDVSYSYDPTWNVLFFTAGLLQHPIFDIRVPMYMNFGAMGRLVGSTLVQAIDTYGEYYDPSGYYTDWWSATTKSNFQSVQQCHVNLFYNATIDGYNINEEADWLLDIAAMHWREVAGLQTSLAAYHAYVAQNGPELALPGLNTDTNDEALFISWAQSFCYNRDPLYTLLYFIYYGQEPEQLLVDATLRNVPAFASTFKCPATSQYIANATNCQGF